MHRASHSTHSLRGSASSIRHNIGQDEIERKPSRPGGAVDIEDDSFEDRERRATIQTASDSEMDEDPDFGDKSLALHKPHTHDWGILHLRSQEDDDPTDWWFASTAIPLIAATFAPMANLLSIAALVVYWRNEVKTPDDPLTYYSNSVGYKDPHWVTYANIASLVCGFVGNLFLLFNFTKRVRYIIALPLTIIFFYAACGILIGIIVCTEKYAPPGPDEVYSQGYWHAVIAACLYMFNSMVLMVNMWGYFLGHYPQNFKLTDEHRNLILQTMLFFIWLGGGAGVFARCEQWSYPDALYFCDVTILTIGFGDYVATNDLGRGLVFPYSVGGTIILGLMVTSIHKFARELSKDNIVRKHVERRRVNTLSRAVTIEELDDSRLKRLATGQRLSITRPMGTDTQRIQEDLNEMARLERLKRRTVNFDDPNAEIYVSDEVAAKDDSALEPAPSQFLSTRHDNGFIHATFRALTFPVVKPVTMTTNKIRRTMSKNQQQILMFQERDRFNAMRQIQINASTFKRYYALLLSIIAFGMLWCLGAVVFYYAEAYTQGLSYFQCLYFAYVSLLTIGYGDFSPRSNSGKAFFVVWSLIAVPTMTILVSDLGDTVIGGFKRGVLQNDLGLTSKGSSATYRSSTKRLLARLHLIKKYTPPEAEDSEGVEEKKQEEASSDESLNREEAGVLPSNTQNARNNRQDSLQPKTIEELASENVSEAEMMRRLAFAIRQTADELKTEPGKKYGYEDWVQFTRLIKFSKFDKAMLRSGEASAMQQLEYDEAVDGVVEWDWLDAKSPMTSQQTEGEWILDRLCESLLRVFKKSDLVLGGLDAGKVVRHPAIPEEQEEDDANETTTNPGFEVVDFGARSRRYSTSSIGRSPSPPSPVVGRRRRGSDLGLRAPEVMNKMTRFIQGDNPDDDTPQWSRRAQAKQNQNQNQNQNTEDGDPRASGDIRRRSLTQVPMHKRHGPFAQRPGPMAMPSPPFMPGGKRMSG